MDLKKRMLMFMNQFDELLYSTFHLSSVLSDFILCWSKALTKCLHQITEFDAIFL